MAYPEWNLPRCRWQEQLRGVCQIAVAESGSYFLLIRLRNLARNQNLRILSGGTASFDGPIPITSDHDFTLEVEVHLHAPRTLVILQASSSGESPEGRPLVLLLTAFEVSRRPLIHPPVEIAHRTNSPRFYERWLNWFGRRAV